MPDRNPPAPGLAVLALRYAAGDLPAGERDAFELRLAVEQSARDALAEAIRLSASALGQAPPTPSSAVRAGVRERLFPTWLTRLFPRRSYRGHPAAWAGLGGGVTAAVALVWLSLAGEPSPAPFGETQHSFRRALPAVQPVTGAEPDPAVPDSHEATPVAAEPAAIPSLPGTRAERVGDPPNPMQGGAPGGISNGCDPANG